jgi:hypothetical protein
MRGIALARKLIQLYCLINESKFYSDFSLVHYLYPKSVSNHAILHKMHLEVNDLYKLVQLYGLINHAV